MAVPVKEEKAALILLRSPREDTYLGEPIPGIHDNRPKMDMRILVIHVQYITEHQTRFTLIV